MTANCSFGALAWPQSTPSVNQYTSEPGCAGSAVRKSNTRLVSSMTITLAARRWRLVPRSLIHFNMRGAGIQREGWRWQQG